MSWLGRQLGDALSATASGRMASMLYVLCGSLVVLASLLPLPANAHPIGLLLVGLIAVGYGAVLWLLPWDRWTPSASLYAVVPVALALIALHNVSTGSDGFRYGLFFLVLFAWVGLSHAPGTSLRLSPLLVVAYVAPMVLASHVEQAMLASLAYAVPISVLVGETAASAATRLRSSESAHRASEARWRSLVINASDLILVIGPDAIVKYATPAVERLFGYPEESSEGMQVLDLIHPDDLGFVVERLGQSIERPGPGEHIEFRVLRADGTYTWVESIGTNLLDEPTVGGIVCNVRDISERKEAERVLRHRAHHDSLTGLPNRLALAETVAGRIGEGHQPFALLLLDLDRFKDINDGLGHETGDHLLVEVARRLAGGARPGDTVARLGGDEFAVVASGVTDAAEAEAVAAALQDVLDEPFELDGMVLHVGASIGIAVEDNAPGASLDNVTLLLQRADVAMYRAKASGIGCATFGVEDEQDRPARLAMVSDLRAALDTGDIRTHFQPQVDITTGLVEQVEVLARWTRNGQSVPPDEFIPLAEHTGLIGRLTAEVLRQALAQCRRWSDVGLPISVAVNVSAPSLRDGDFVRSVREALQAAGVPPERLTLEITESALAEQTETAVSMMEALRASGVRLSIDDFGSGYSSMAYLKRLPIDELKIDRVFITDMLTDTRDQPITRAIIELAHSLNLSVVAEGVESPALTELLRRFGCDAVQGFGLCRPVPADELTAWLSERAAAYVAPAPRRHITAVAGR